MKDKEKQIQEIAQIICGRSKDDICIIDNTSCDSSCCWARNAEAIYNADYRKVSADTLILTENQLKKIIEEEYKKALKSKVVLTTEEYQDLVVKSMGNFSSAMVKASKETAEKLIKLIEFHSISKRDESGYETFTISNLCLREILREEFGFTNEELETIYMNY